MSNINTALRRTFFREVLRIALLIIVTMLLYTGGVKLITYQNNKFTESSQEITQLREKIYISAGGIKEYREYLSQTQQIDIYSKIMRNFDPKYAQDIILIGTQTYQLVDCQVKLNPLDSNLDNAIYKQHGFNHARYNILISCTTDNETNFFRFIDYLNHAMPGTVITKRFSVRQYNKHNTSLLEKDYTGLMRTELQLDWYFLTAI